MKAFSYLYLFLVVTELLSGESLEIATGFDGARRIHGTLLYSGKECSAGTNIRLSRDMHVTAAAGMNTDFFSIGHLGDSGLASEIRNPESTALSRLSERTVFRADLRADSFSRAGLALMPWKARAGVVWEHRERIDAGLIWGLPVNGEHWRLEFLGEGGLLVKVPGDVSWYPDSSGSPGGPFVLLAGRLRYLSSGWSTGLSLMVSGGVSLYPGWLSACSCNYSSGPWRIRFRGMYSSLFFRNADGRYIREQAGGSLDCRYRPSEGLQFAVDYHAGYETAFIDEGNAALGWRFGEIQVSVESDWNCIFFGPETSGTPDLERLKGRLIWDRDYLHLGIQGGFNSSRDWYFRLDSAFPTHGIWLLEPYVEVHGVRENLLLDIRLKGRWDIGRNRLIISIFAGDFGRDWADGPKSAEDFNAEIRWIRKLH
jgi:hypothetical protein